MKRTGEAESLLLGKNVEIGAEQGNGLFRLSEQEYRVLIALFSQDHALNARQVYLSVTKRFLAELLDVSIKYMMELPNRERPAVKEEKTIFKLNQPETLNNGNFIVMERKFAPVRFGPFSFGSVPVIKYVPVTPKEKKVYSFIEKMRDAITDEDVEEVSSYARKELGAGSPSYKTVQTILFSLVRDGFVLEHITDKPKASVKKKDSIFYLSPHIREEIAVRVASNASARS